jgi:hypothetical protein
LGAKGRATGLGSDDVDVLAAVVVDAGRVSSHEGDPAPVRRPGRKILVERGVGRERRRRGARHVEQHEVAAHAGGEITLLVLLEVHGVDHDGLRRLRILFAVLNREHEVCAVRGPVVGADVVLGLEDRARLAAAPVEQQELFVFGPRGYRQIRQVSAVGTPTRRVRPVSGIRELHSFPAVPALHPDRAARFVGLLVVARDDIGDPETVGGHPRLRKGLDPVEIVGVEGAARGRGIGRGPGGTGR